MAESITVPTGVGPTPGLFVTSADTSLAVVVLHEWWGLAGPHSNIARICDDLGKAGFPALAPDLYGGASANDPSAARALATGLKWEEAKPRIEGGIAEARKRGAGRVALLGFSMGAQRGMKATMEGAAVEALVLFYGLGAPIEESKVNVPVLGHFVVQDEFVPIDEVREVEHRLKTAGKKLAFQYYDAQHSFMNEKLPSHQPQSAQVAWERTLKFLGAARKAG